MAISISELAGLITLANPEKSSLVRSLGNPLYETPVIPERFSFCGPSSHSTRPAASLRSGAALVGARCRACRADGAEHSGARAPVCLAARSMCTTHIFASATAGGRARDSPNRAGRALACGPAAPASKRMPIPRVPQSFPGGISCRRLARGLRLSRGHRRLALKVAAPLSLARCRRHLHASMQDGILALQAAMWPARIKHCTKL